MSVGRENILGVDIGGTKCAVILGSLDRTRVEIEIVDRTTFLTETSRGKDYTIGRIFEGIDGILQRNMVEITAVKGIGISCGGPLDSKRGLVLSPPNLPGWDSVPIADMLEKRYGVKAKLQNDANACALAEWKFGAGRGTQNMIFLTFGTGMGAGLILGGRLYEGTNGMAGEVGHLRLDSNGPVGFGKAGSFEGYCSGGGIAQLARSKVLEKVQMGEVVSFCSGMDELERLDAKRVAEAANAGDPLALEIYAISGKYLGKGLSLLIDAFNPERIVIGSIFTRCRHLLWPEAEKAIEQEAISHNRSVCSVVCAGLGESIGDYAALAVAFAGEL